MLSFPAQGRGVALKSLDCLFCRNDKQTHMTNFNTSNGGGRVDIFRNIRRTGLSGIAFATKCEKMTTRCIIKVLTSFIRTASLEEIIVDESAWGKVGRIREQLL